MLAVLRALALGACADEIPAPAEFNETPAPGLEYRRRELTEPRPNRVHILRVDLARRGIRPAVVLAPDPDGEGPAEAALTDPFKLADDPAVVAFINVNPWDSLPDAAGQRNRSWFAGQPVNLHGLAVAGGRERSAATPGGASVWLDESGRAFLGDVPRGQRVAEGTAGFQPIVREGVGVAVAGGPLHPRTAIGLDPTGTVLWLVVVDGRQAGYSEGMTLEELGGVMRGLGCWLATNVDGGGSSVMGLADGSGRLRAVNRPSDRSLLGAVKVRPLPLILTIRRTSADGPGASPGAATAIP